MPLSHKTIVSQDNLGMFVKEKYFREHNLHFDRIQFGKDMEKTERGRIWIKYVFDVIADQLLAMMARTLTSTLKEL